jgi:hypothetical protein
VATQYTPGPWHVTDEIDWFHGGEVIRPGDPTRRESPVAVVCDFNRYDRDQERQANARLIAAPPRMATFIQAIAEHNVAGLVSEARAILREAGLEA